MAEQISHKKSLRISSSNKDKRLLLKEFYKLDGGEDTNITEHPFTNESSVSTADLTDVRETVTEEKLEDEAVAIIMDKSYSDAESVDSMSIRDIEERPLNELEFKDILHIHNTLLSKETETNNSIKNTIYDNYYDLIKVNDLLKELTNSKHTQVEKLKDTIDSLMK